MNNSATNVANVNTDNYVPRETTISESQNGSTKANTTQAKSSSGSEKSQTDLSKEMTDQIGIEKVAASNVQAIRTQNEMLGSLLDIRG
jgi:flagellar hook protein FlgE